MKSGDTNLLLYAMNRGCAEHAVAKRWLERALAEPREWIFADQVLFELYRLLRHPRVLAKPLMSTAALAQLQWFREDTGFLHCGYDESRWVGVMEAVANQGERSGLLIYDAVLAETLRSHGVVEFHTRNSRDFESFRCFKIVNPLD
ncbi:MAG: TA system VapC family ribonuclease toxin [Opitutales bacterium]